MKEFRETFKERLDDHEFRDAVYDLILELTRENEELRQELAQHRAADELTKQAQDLDMGY